MSTELTTPKGGALALPNEELNDMFGSSHLDTTTGLSFNVVKIMRESAQFDCGNDDYQKKLTGHILFKHRANQFWAKSFEERGEGDSPVPDCYSTDGVKPCGGENVQCDLCATCTKNKFGSGKDGSGKACRNTVRFLFLVDGHVLPVVLAAPPTSLSKKGSLQQWLNDVPNKVSAAYNALNIRTAKGTPIVDYWPAHVELTLEKEKFSSGMEASVLKIKTLDVVTPQTPEGANKLKTLFSLVKEAGKAYQDEMTQYVESEAQAEDAIENAESVAAGGDDDEIPI